MLSCLSAAHVYLPDDPTIINVHNVVVFDWQSPSHGYHQTDDSNNRQNQVCCSILWGDQANCKDSCFDTIPYLDMPSQNKIIIVSMFWVLKWICESPYSHVCIVSWELVVPFIWDHLLSYYRFTNLDADTNTTSCSWWHWEPRPCLAMMAQHHAKYGQGDEVI